MERLINESRTLTPPESLREAAVIQDYEALYLHSISFPERYWDSVARELTWFKPWSKTMNFNPPRHEWFVGGQCNITVNALDRHAKGRDRNKVALIWTTETGYEELITYGRLLRRVCQLANAMKAVGVGKGDRVLIYMPQSPEAIATMLACARIGAIHTVVYAGMGVQAVRARIIDSQPKLIFCADVNYRGGKLLPLKSIVEAACDDLDGIEKIVVHRRQTPQIELMSDLEIDFFDFIEHQPQWIEPEVMEANDPLCILYTSGTTGKPKGVVHAHGGYMVGTYNLARTFYDLGPSDVIWCTSNIAWIVGHSYIVYGPLLCGATALAREGSLDYPNTDVVWRNIERHGVNILFTVPTAIRKFMRGGETTEQALEKFDLSSLRLIASGGQPLNPEAHIWAQENMLGGKGHVIDNWWQTEIAAPVLGTLPGMTAKLGKVGKPMPTVVANIVDENHQTVDPNTTGRLVLRRPVPYMMTGIWNNDELYRGYWEEIPGFYDTGDVAFYDEDGYFCVLGRHEDVVNISGHSIRVAEVESTLMTHPQVKEAAVIGLPDDVTGEQMRAFVVLKPGIEKRDNLQSVLRDHVRRELGPIATPQEILTRDSLPRNSNGTVMRRLLRAESLGVDPGDTSAVQFSEQRDAPI